MKLSTLKLNESNPRTITDDKFKLLCDSIREFPKMMAIRPIVVDNKNDRIVLGGNMRYRACIANGLDDVPDNWVIFADDMTPDEKRRFIIADNVGFGQWDWDLIANDWDTAELLSWGLDIPHFDATDEQITKEPDTVNFIIKCTDDEQLSKLQSKLDTDQKIMGFEQFIIKSGL